MFLYGANMVMDIAAMTGIHRPGHREIDVIA